jgi:hypothetical protein
VRDEIWDLFYTKVTSLGIKVAKGGDAKIIGALKRVSRNNPRAPVAAVIRSLNDRIKDRDAKVTLTILAPSGIEDPVSDASVRIITGKAAFELKGSNRVLLLKRGVRSKATVSLRKRAREADVPIVFSIEEAFAKAVDPFRYPKDVDLVVFASMQIARKSGIVTRVGRVDLTQAQFIAFSQAYNVALDDADYTVVTALAAPRGLLQASRQVPFDFMSEGSAMILSIISGRWALAGDKFQTQTGILTTANAVFVVPDRVPRVLSDLPRVANIDENPDQVVVKDLQNRPATLRPVFIILSRPLALSSKTAKALVRKYGNIYPVYRLQEQPAAIPSTKIDEANETENVFTLVLQVKGSDGMEDRLLEFQNVPADLIHEMPKGGLFEMDASSFTDRTFPGFVASLRAIMMSVPAVRKPIHNLGHIFIDGSVPVSQTWTFSITHQAPSLTESSLQLLAVIRKRQLSRTYIAAYGTNGIGKSIFVEHIRARVPNVKVIEDEEFFDTHKITDFTDEMTLMEELQSLIPEWREWVRLKTDELENEDAGQPIRSPILVIAHWPSYLLALETPYILVKLLPVLDPVSAVLARGRNLDHEIPFSEINYTQWKNGPGIELFLRELEDVIAWLHQHDIPTDRRSQGEITEAEFTANIPSGVSDFN